MAAMILLGVGFVIGRRSAPTPEVPAPIARPRVSPPPTPAPAVLAALDRSDLLALAAKAADAHASNIGMPAEISAATGRRFDLVLPFGCEASGAVESPGTMRWKFEPKAATLRITVDPTTWRGEEWGSGSAGDGAAGFRGFWIPRPWSTATSCAAHGRPRADVGGMPILLPGRTVAIAQVISADAVGKDRAFQVVQRSTANGFDPEQGFQLRILGRIRSPSGGSPVKCVQPGGGEQPPLCVITASFAEVRIENPRNGAVLASWPIGDDVRENGTTGSPDDAAEQRQRGA